MAQVYSFTDENGVTRLFAEIHPDPAGTPFNGGTITEGLTIADPDGAEDQLTITGTGAGGAKLINAVAVHTTFTVDSDGTVAMSSDDGMGVQVSASGGTHASVAVNEASGRSLTLGSLGGLNYNNGSVNAVQLNDVLFLFHINSAPADGSLVAGDCALWFDSTNGAAALNVKAKQADGTVKTATIPVVT